MAEKMIVVPADVWERQRDERQHALAPTMNALQRIEKSVMELLDTDEISDFDKVKLLNYHLRRYKTVFENRPRESAVFELKSSDSAAAAAAAVNVEDLVRSFPKNLQQRAASVLNVIKSDSGDGSLGWDSNRHLLVAGQLVPGSNIVDLVRDAIDSSGRRRLIHSAESSVWAQFVRKLKQLNVPKAVISNIARLESLVGPAQPTAAVPEQIVWRELP